MSKHLQWFRFEPAVWLADPGLRLCSLAARGLWMDMLSLMYQSTPVGTLRANGKPMTPAMLAGTIRGDTKTVEKCLGELEKNRVFSRTKSGVIFSRRIRADHERLTNNRANGKLGGNPTLSKQRRIRKPLKAESESESESESEGARSRALNAHSRASRPANDTSYGDEIDAYVERLKKEAAAGNG